MRPGHHYAQAPHLDYDDAVYNPVLGFEPYWPVGEWVYKETYTTFYVTTSTVPPLVYGRPCPKQYRHIKEVCTHKLSNTWQMHGCKNWDAVKVTWWGWCHGGYMDHLYGYHTFPTFCRFIDFNTKFSVYNSSVFIHVGPCVKHHPVYHPHNPLFFNEDLQNSEPNRWFHLLRYDYWMGELNRTFFNTTTEKEITLAPPIDMGALLDDP